MSLIKQGDQVETLDDIVRGKVIRVVKGQALVATRDGFSLWFDISDLVKVEGDRTIHISLQDVARIKGEKEAKKTKKAIVPKPKSRTLPPMEIDLHIEKLIPSTRNLTNFEILNIQLDTAKKQIDFAIRKRIQKVVFIHGVGEGVLREELYSLFRRYDFIRYYDASYQKYGAGATEIYIMQNP